MSEYRARIHMTGTTVTVNFTGKSQYEEAIAFWEEFLSLHDPEPEQYTAKIVRGDNTTLINLCCVAGIEFLTVNNGVNGLAEGGG